MVQQVVIDTNVFMHAANPKAVEFAASMRLLEDFEKDTASLCIDKPRDDSPDDLNASLILAEYKKKMLPGTVGFAILARLARSRRVQLVSRDVGPRLARIVLRLVHSNKRDRTFLRTACNAADKLLITNDYTDFTNMVRAAILAQLEVRVEDSSVLWVSL